MRFSSVPRLPAGVGIGFKPDFFDGLVDGTHRPAFLEVHAENYMGAGGLPHFQLGRLRELYPISLHGVGLSIGGERPLDREHLNRLRLLIDRYEPASFSEHLAWSSHDVAYFNDLLPVAYNRDTLDRVCDHIDLVQEYLRCRMLLENPSTYVEFSSSTMDEVDFLAAIARRTGCGLLLDVNNVQVSCVNHRRDPFAYLDAFPVEAVGEIHLGGHAEDQDDLGDRLLIDSHDRPVDADVWVLYARLVRRMGPCATLIEWDNDVPPLAELMSEARRAGEILHAEALEKRQNTGHRA
ncbi:MAG: hypothetical protein FD175_2065 [Beijerinckiaceae bacterium]|nr:MAG: hypothetical protein FD175_2065 [Beijerinckiaceae bacterium]